MSRSKRRADTRKNRSNKKPGAKKKSRRRSERSAKAQHPKRANRKSPHSRTRGRSPRETLTGRVQKNPKGFAFIIADDKHVEDTYVAVRHAQDLMTNDKVEFIRVHQGPKWLAKKVRVLERASSKLVGKIQNRKSQYYLENKEFSIPLQVKKSEKRPTPGQWAIAQVKQFPEKGNSGTALLSDTLGAELGPEHDFDITCTQYGLETDFPKGVLKQARSYSQDSIQPEARTDFRDLPFVTIDGEDAKDFDDAVMVEKTANGYRLIVAIADVAHYVTKGTPLDKEAYRRGTSVYFPGVCIPMLPEELSNGLCSLRPREERLTLSAEIHFDRSGNRTKCHFHESIIKTWHRITYHEMEQFKQKEARAQKKFANITKPLHHLYELYQILNQKRAERGVLDFDLPETFIIVDESGTPESIKPTARFDSHRLIEEFMIAANEAVAFTLKKQGLDAMFRVHESPDLEGLDEINQLLDGLGIKFRIKKNTPKAFAEILSKTDNRAETKTLHKFILRKQKQARYDPAPKGHFGLALKDYCHFTSPIRRYPDLVVHRVLKRLIQKQKYVFPTTEDIESASKRCSERERLAMEAERFIRKRKQCWFLQDRIEDEFNGTISSITDYGLFVEIEPYAIDVFVPSSYMENYYEYDARKMCLRQRPGSNTLMVGDNLRIQLLESDPFEASIVGREA